MVDGYTIVDLTHTLHEKVRTWTGKQEVRIVLHNDDEVGFRSMHYSMAAGVGTHIDAPKHFIDEWPTIETLALDMLIGPCRVYQLDCPKVISESDLRDLDFDQVQRVLFKTANSQRINDS